MERHSVNQEDKKNILLTSSHGCPIKDKFNSMTAGPFGPLVLHDNVLIEELAHFDRERIPERVVHAKGAGAFGYFEVTHDITKYCKASVFKHLGSRCPIAVRFSTVGGESGSGDSERDPRGFAVKFYTEEGNWDLVGNNTPIFFIRDPILFPSFIHTQKRHPATHLKDPNMFWDFITLRQETTHMVSFLFSDRGTPDGYRHMNGYGSHTFKMVNETGDSTYVKFHYKTDQGIKTLSHNKAEDLLRDDPDYAIRDLWNSIENKNYPSYTMYIQVLENLNSVSFNPFDLTKVWPHSEFPLIPVGKLVLNRNPQNYFAEVEQIAFCPGNLIPGIEPSPDKMLQARIFSYSDTQRHRLGANYEQLPINCPYKAKVNSTARDGPMCLTQGSEPNYYPNSLYDVFGKGNRFVGEPYKISNDVIIVDRYETGKEDNFSQAKTFYNHVLSEDERERLTDNIVEHLRHAKDVLQSRAISQFSSVDPDYGQRIKRKLQMYNS